MAEVLFVRLARVARGMAAYQLAAKVGCNPQTWLLVEKGVKQAPKKLRKRTEAVLGIPEETLFAPAEALFRNMESESTVQVSRKQR